MNMDEDENQAALERYTKCIFKDEQDDKGNAWNAVWELYEIHNMDLELFEILANIMKDWYKLGESITWDQRLQDPVRTNPRDGTRSIMQKFEMEAKARAVYVSTSAVGLLQALLIMDINGAEILGKWGNTAIGVQAQGAHVVGGSKGLHVPATDHEGLSVL